jgi:hypothetical protein
MTAFPCESYYAQLNKYNERDRNDKIIKDLKDKNDRIYKDMETMIDPKYNDKYFVHRVIRFLRDHPERAPDYIDFVGDDWETRNIDDVQRI